MKTAKEFMSEFFRARMVEEKRHQASRLPFRSKYFAEDCRYDSHAGALKRMESERITNVSETDSGCMVDTEQTLCYSGGTKTMRLRYHLQLMSDGWLIRTVHTACFVCGGLGDSTCPYCKGKQWLGTGHELD